MPAKAGIQGSDVVAVALDPRFRGGDDSPLIMVASFQAARSVLVVIVKPLRWWVALQPFAVPFDIFFVARTVAQLADPGVEKQPPLEIARL